VIAVRVTAPARKYRAAKQRRRKRDWHRGTAQPQDATMISTGTWSMRAISRQQASRRSARQSSSRLSAPRCLRSGRSIRELAFTNVAIAFHLDQQFSAARWESPDRDVRPPVSRSELTAPTLHQTNLAADLDLFTHGPSTFARTRSPSGILEVRHSRRLPWSPQARVRPQDRCGERCRQENRPPSSAAESPEL